MRKKYEDKMDDTTRRCDARILEAEQGCRMEKEKFMASFDKEKDMLRDTLAEQTTEKKKLDTQFEDEIRDLRLKQSVATRELESNWVALIMECMECMACKTGEA